MEKVLAYIPQWDHIVGAFIAFIIPFTISRISRWLRNSSKKEGNVS
jgi:hypothetical protein